MNSLGAVSLHALSYDHRDEADQYGVLYSGLHSCQVSDYDDSKLETFHPEHR